jgi:hypothetical protein
MSCTKPRIDFENDSIMPTTTTAGTTTTKQKTTAAMTQLFGKQKHEITVSVTNKLWFHELSVVLMLHKTS